MKTLWWVGGIVVAAAVLAFGYWTISPFFRDVMLDEALPGQEQQETSAPGSADADQGIGDASQEPQATGAQVVGTAGHPASGTARLVEADGATYVRYENFKTLNGPDLFVYLSKDMGASDFIDLGRLRATEGNINYEVPAGVDPSEYPYVLVWCRAFGVLFNYAKLN